LADAAGITAKEGKPHPESALVMAGVVVILVRIVNPRGIVIGASTLKVE
jgi:hypothetical protein